MKEMYNSLKEWFQESPADFMKSILLFTGLFTILYIALAIGGN